MEWLILEGQDYVVIYPVNKITIEPENLLMSCKSLHRQFKKSVVNIYFRYLEIDK